MSITSPSRTAKGGVDKEKYKRKGIVFLLFSVLLFILFVILAPCYGGCHRECPFRPFSIIQNAFQIKAAIPAFFSSQRDLSWTHFDPHHKKKLKRKKKKTTKELQNKMFHFILTLNTICPPCEGNKTVAEGVVSHPKPLLYSLFPGLRRGCLFSNMNF